MTPAARIQAAIELLGEIAGSAAPAERAVGAYTRARRYMGAKDRRAIADLVYGMLRRQARLDWWLARVGVEAQPRATAIAYLTLVEGREPAALATQFDGSRYGPSPIDEAEGALAAALAGQALDCAEQPDWVRAEVPDWLWGEVARGFGADARAEAAALAAEAPVDLRVNTLKASRADAAAALAAAGIEAAPTPLSPVGLRVAGRRNVTGTAPFRDGWVEVQDEGSQIVALLVGARPGMAVADVCAGGGGKALALAATMENRGRLLALDVDQARLDRAASRLARAGASLVERRVLGADDDLAGEARAFDRVLVDAPCSGSGAWRRAPDARWRLDGDRLAAYHAAQGQALARAALLPRPGGRLVYATCSILPSENERAVAAFLAGHPDFAAVPGADAWRAALAAAPPEGTITEDGWIALTPHRHGTDGFFVAVMERAGTDTPRNEPCPSRPK